ncbi:MAG: hypothetical protein OHK0036_04910 [Bacteroidia bacterium]
MNKNQFNTPAGVWLQWLIQLKNEGLSIEEIDDLNGYVTDLTQTLLYYYDSDSMELHDNVRKTLDEVFQNIIEMMKNGFSIDQITDFLMDIENAYVLPDSEHNPDLVNFFENYLNKEDNDFDNDDEDDDDEDDDDDFDPRKFFPKR